MRDEFRALHTGLDRSITALSEAVDRLGIVASGGLKAIQTVRRARPARTKPSSNRTIGTDPRPIA
jgi:hypothetical protein